MPTDWNPLLRGEFEKPYWPTLQTFVRGERGFGYDPAFLPVDHPPGDPISPATTRSFCAVPEKRSCGL